MENKELGVVEFRPLKRTLIKNALAQLGADLGLLVVGVFLQGRIKSLSGRLVLGVTIVSFVYLLFELTFSLIRLPKMLALTHPTLVLTPEDLTFTLPNPNLSTTINENTHKVLWEDLSDISLFRSGFVHLVALDLKEKEEDLWVFTAQEAKRLKEYRRLTGSDLVFSITEYDIKPEELLEQIKDYHAASQSVTKKATETEELA